MILPAGGFWPISGNLFWLSQEEAECYRHSIGRDQRGRQTSRNAQDSPTAIIQPKMPILQRLRNPGTGDRTTQHSDFLWNLELRLRNEFTIDHPLIRANIFLKNWKVGYELNAWEGRIKWANRSQNKRQKTNTAWVSSSPPLPVSGSASLHQLLIDPCDSERSTLGI